MLTGKQEKFAQLVAQGKTKSDAYREAYDSDDMQDNTINSRASELAKDSEITVRIDELRKEYSEHLKYDAEAHFKKLKMLEQLALTPSGDKGDIKISEAIKAVVEQGKLCVLYIDRSEIKGTIDIKATLDKIENEY